MLFDSTWIIQVIIGKHHSKASEGIIWIVHYQSDGQRTALNFSAQRIALRGITLKQHAFA